MKTEFEKLIEISTKLSLNHIRNRLISTHERVSGDNTELIIPIVGEFSSGKTTLLNAVLTNKNLETSSTPTTSVIFEIRFSQLDNSVSVIKNDGSKINIESPAAPNINFDEIKIIKVFDTSKVFAKSTLLIDTPGLSSLDAKHKKILIEYLPNADLIILAVDVNQTITASVIDFIDSISQVKRRIYIILTKCDTKSVSEVNQIKQHLQDSLKFEVIEIIRVAALKNDIEEFKNLIVKIQTEKIQIIEDVTNLRIALLKNQLIDHVNELLQTSRLSTKGIDLKIIQKKNEIRNIQNEVNIYILNLRKEFNNINEEIISEYNATSFSELEHLANNPPRLSDATDETQIALDNICSITIENIYKPKILKAIKYSAQEVKKNKSSINTLFLENLDLTEVDINGIVVNVDLNLPEVQLINKCVAIGLKIAAAGLIAAASPVAGSGMVVEEIIDFEAFKTTFETINHADKLINQSVKAFPNSQGGPSKGVLEELIGKLTEHAYIKPQRKRIINAFIYSSLQPEFRLKVENASNTILIGITKQLYDELNERNDLLIQSLETLMNEKQANENDYNQKIIELQKFKNELTAHA